MTCVHHYIIAEPDGRKRLPGVCKRCGFEREFAAAGEDWTMRDAAIVSPRNTGYYIGEDRRNDRIRW